MHFYIKKITLLCLAFVCCFSVCAQTFDIGLNGAAESAWLINPEISHPGTDQGYRPSFSYNYGGNFTWYIHQTLGLDIEILEETLTQGYGGTFHNTDSLPGNNLHYKAGETYTAKTKLTSMSIPILLRYEDDYKKIYYEGGFAYNIVSAASYSASLSGPPGSVNYDVTKQFTKNDFFAVAGLGIVRPFAKNSSVFFHFGARLSYSLLDLGGVDGHGQDLLGGPSINLYYNNHPYYTAYHTTHAIVIGLNAGIFCRLPWGRKYIYGR